MALKIFWIIDKLTYYLMGQKFEMFNISSKFINIYKVFETIKKKVVHPWPELRLGGHCLFLGIVSHYWLSINIDKAKLYSDLSFSWMYETQQRHVGLNNVIISLWIVRGVLAQVSLFVKYYISFGVKTEMRSWLLGVRITKDLGSCLL